MRYAVISDIHANLEALRAVLARIEDLGADKVVCLGDVVGYNADPNACIDIVRSEDISCVLGNHDAAACGLTEPVHFNPAARTAVLWTRDVLTGENREFLRALPRILVLGDILLCHGSIEDTNRYLIGKDDVRGEFDLMETMPENPRACFFGHTHVKEAFSMGSGGLSRITTDNIVVTPGVRYLINPGGIGQPRDGDPDAPFLMYDVAERSITFHRVAYNVAATQAKVLQAGLPAQLALRLSMGR